MADKAANLAHENDRSTIYYLSLQEKLCILNKSYTDYWKNYWYANVDETQKGLRLKQLRSPKFVTFPVPTLLGNRRDEINIFRLRIGHVGLGEHLFRTKQKDDNTCECGDRETIQHYLFECELYEQQRIRLCRELIEIICPSPNITEKLLLGMEEYNIKTKKYLNYSVNTSEAQGDKTIYEVYRQLDQAKQYLFHSLISHLDMVW